MDGSTDPGQMSGAPTVVSERVICKFDIWEKVPSANKWERMHWYMRHRIKMHFYEQVALHVMIKDIPKKIGKEQFPIQLRFTQLIRREGKVYDCDNWVYVANKVMADALKFAKVIPDDNPKYVKEPTMKPVESGYLQYGVRVEVLAV